MKNFDYWMLGIIGEALEKQKVKLPRIPHMNCSLECRNRWCKIGQRNLILERINEIQVEYTEEYFKQEVQK